MMSTSLSMALGLSQCRALPFVHSLSGRDTNSYPYFTGKKSWIKTSNTASRESFGEDATDITSDIVKEARNLTTAVYTTRADSFEESDLASAVMFEDLRQQVNTPQASTTIFTVFVGVSSCFGGVD